MKNHICLNKGLSLIEVMIAFAVTSIILACSFPYLIDQAVRDRVNVSLKLAEPAKQALQEACRVDETAVVTRNIDAGYFYIPTGTKEDYLNRILLGADCARDTMVIVIWTGATGAATDPVLEWATNRTGDSWTCRVIRGELRHIPQECQNSYEQI